MSLVGRIKQGLRDLPLKFMVGMILLMWVSKEFYPLSHFPMYSDFSEWDYVVFIADQEGTPLPVAHLTRGTRTAKMKKKFNGEIHKVRAALAEPDGTRPRKQDLTAGEMESAGLATLDWLMPRLERDELRRLYPDVTALRIYQIAISYADGRLLRSEPCHIATREVPR